MIGCSFTILVPIVLMIFQPPDAVPAAMASAQATLTQSGTPASGPSTPAPIIAKRMIPMAFWASLAPWVNAMNAAASTCKGRNSAFTLCGSQPRKSQ
ncbi:hypothetical protein D3C72_120040 [compost metagenome]